MGALAPFESLFRVNFWPEIKIQWKNKFSVKKSKMKITVEKAPPSLAQEVVEEEGAIDLTKDVKFEEIKLGNK